MFFQHLDETLRAWRGLIIPKASRRVSRQTAVYAPVCMPLSMGNGLIIVRARAGGEQIGLDVLNVMSDQSRRSGGVGGSGRRLCIKTQGPASTHVFSRTLRVLADCREIGLTKMHKFAVTLAAAAALLGVLTAAANVPCTVTQRRRYHDARFTDTRFRFSTTSS